MTRAEQIQQELFRIDGVRPSITRRTEKHLKMASNPFRFFRGSASLFYHDISSGLLHIPTALMSGIPNTNIVGDCHLSNFGLFTEEGSHSDKIVFAPNDFDDACIGSPLWDLIRFGCSIQLTKDYCEGVIARDYQTEERENLHGYHSVDANGSQHAITEFLDAYIAKSQDIINDEAQRFKVLNNFSKSHVLRSLEKKAQKRAAGGKHFERKSSLAKAIQYSAGIPQFNHDLPRFQSLKQQHYLEIEVTFSPYVDDAILDIVQRLGAGTGSVNMDRYYLLVGPRNYANQNMLSLCHIVEVKQQRFAAPLHYFGSKSPINSLNPAHLTVFCQRKMQRRPDLVLDEVIWQDKHWLVRSRHHARVGVSPEDIGLSLTNANLQLKQYANSCGKALALAHSRGDRRSFQFEKAICEHLPKYQKQLQQTCIDYAQQVNQDCRQLRADIVK